MDNNQSKSCTKCKTEKTLENYYRNKNHSDGHHATCKECWSYKTKSAPREIQDSSICSKCNIEKSNDNYFQTRKFKCGKQTICKECYTKVCTKCKIEKTLENYFFNNKLNDAHQSICKKCWAEYFTNNEKRPCPKCKRPIGRRHMDAHLKLEWHSLIN
jgi:hypothetical protein